MKKKKNTMKKEEFQHCENAFLTNPVASATDRTGFAQVVPQTDSEAEEYSQMFENVPITSHKDESVPGHLILLDFALKNLLRNLYQQKEPRIKSRRQQS